jgi:hypothetical protein
MLRSARRLSFLVLAGATGLLLHCVDQAMRGTLPDGRAATPPVFDKLDEGQLAPMAASTEYETPSIDVSAYAEVAVRMNNPLYGDADLHVDFVVPAFADTAQGPFLLSGLPIPTGDRVVVNGHFMRLRYLQVNLGPTSRPVPYSIYGVR